MSCAQVILRERGASTGVSDMLSATRFQVLAQRSGTKVSMAGVLVEEAERVYDDEEDKEGERWRWRRDHKS